MKTRLIALSVCFVWMMALAPAGGLAQGADAAAQKAAPAGPTAAGKSRDQKAMKRQRAAYMAQVESLDLTPEQRRDVESLVDREQAWKETNAAKIADIRERLKAARGSGDSEKVKSLTKEAQALMKTRPKMSDILTDAQRKQLREEAKARKAARLQAAESQ